MSDDQSLPVSEPPQMPVENPYVTPAQPPALSQVGRGPVDANGLTNDDKTMGMLIHLLALLTGFIGVLILWLVRNTMG